MSDEALARLGFGGLAAVLDQDLHGGNDAVECLVPGDPLASVARLESMFYMGNTLLRDTDAFSMANSLEARVPFLDQDLAEWIFRLPGETLLPAGAPSKYVLRRLCPEAFSASQLQQHKKGFSLPFSDWMLGPLRDLVEDGLIFLRDAGIVEERGVESVRSTFVANPHSPTWSRMWSLIVCGCWLAQKRNARLDEPVIAMVGGQL
jgi:asparagine synthase (glutamine-hydrolysing)